MRTTATNGVLHELVVYRYSHSQSSRQPVDTALGLTTYGRGKLNTPLK